MSEGTVVTAEGTANAETFAVGAQQLVGRYSYVVREDRWVWSEEMYRLHGFEPGEIVPTTELVFRHKQPGEQALDRDLIAEAVTSGAPFSFTHRIVDAAGHVRTVVAVGSGIKDDTGGVVEVSGYLVDVTTELRRYSASAVAAAVEHRGVIEQAKGMLMLVHGLPADDAFAFLLGASQNTNTKLRAVAERLVVALAARGAGCASEELGLLAVQVLYDGDRSVEPDQGGNVMAQEQVDSGARPISATGQ